MRQRLLAGSLLVVSIALAWATAARLGRLNVLPQRAMPYVVPLLVAVVLAGVSGVLARRVESRDPAPSELPASELARCGVLRWAALIVGLLALGVTWRLQSPRHPPPPLVIATWAAALCALPFAFPAATARAPAGRRPLPHLAFLAGLAAVIAVAFWARLSGLHEAPAVLGGDEVNQIVDGRDWLDGTDRRDPFATGWGGTVRLGMLPAGAGYRWSGSLVAGPRLPYALAGSLSVAGAAAVGGLIAGPWAALATAGFLAVAPHHLHFSRLSSVQILDSLFAVGALALLLATWRGGSPRTAAFAGVASGLSLYGYAGGRVIPIVIAVAAVTIVFARRWSRPRRAWLVLALAAGFAASAGPNIRFAVEHFDEWNARFNQVSVFNGEWIAQEMQRLGSLGEIVQNQLKSGTIGLLSAPDSTPWFTGHPMVGPAILVAAGLAGLGWLIGQRRIVPALLVGLVLAGNLAGEVLTNGAPAPQRASSVMPALAILAGAAFAGLLSLLPNRVGRFISARGAVGALGAGAVLATGIRGYPLDPEPYARYGGGHAAFVQSAAGLLDTPRFRGRPIHLHGLFLMNSTFPGVRHFLPAVRFIDDDPDATDFTAASFPPGVHVFTNDWIEAGEAWRQRLGVRRAIRLAHPAIPAEDAGYAFIVPPDSTTPASR